MLAMDRPRKVRIAQLEELPVETRCAQVRILVWTHGQVACRIHGQRGNDV